MPKTSSKKKLQENSIEPKEILDMRTVHGRNEYLVQWKGFKKSDSTWEQNFKNKELIKKFLQSRNKKNNESDEKSKTKAPTPVKITDSYIIINGKSHKIYYKVLFSNDTFKTYESNKVYQEIPELGVQYLIKSQMPPGKTYYCDKAIRDV